MVRHLFVPNADLLTVDVREGYRTYLEEWREKVRQDADRGDVAASVCLQATLVDLAIDRKPTHDWLGVMQEFLTKDGRPQAYSALYGRRLHRFDKQYQQTTIHAIHTRWWIERLVAPDTTNHEAFAQMMVAKRQSDGLFYDGDVSPTILRHRMKSELTLSMAMSCEVLNAAGHLTPTLQLQLATDVVAPGKCPPLGYITMEYFRLVSLSILGQIPLFPPSIGSAIRDAGGDLPFGWCDFSIASKVDAYMGTRKRTQRDKPISSPLVACCVGALLDRCEEPQRAAILDRLTAYAGHLAEQPNDIPAFQMRDVPIPFGAGITPIEALCAAVLVKKWLRH